MKKEQDQEQRVLLIEDDDSLAGEIVSLFAELTLPVIHVANGSDGLRRALAEDFSLLLLDVKLPGKNGLDICREVRAAKPGLPIIFLTTLGQDLDRVLGFELGADDYVVKPFRSAELLARVRAKLRRVAVYTGMAAEGDDTTLPVPLEVAGLVIDPATRSLTKDNTVVELTAKEFDLLYFLMQRPGVVYSKADLLWAVWGVDNEAYDKSVVTMIARLRRKLEDSEENPRYIRTIRSVGYSFVNPDAPDKG